jgi:hypothetical protein
MATRIEAENGTDLHNVSAFSFGSSSNGQMVGVIGATDKWVEFTLSIATTGSYLITLAYRYSQDVNQGMPTTSAPRIIVDGATPIDVSVGSDNNIMTIDFPAQTLSAGSHTLILTHGGTPGNSPFTVDYIEYSGININPSDPSGLTATASSSSVINLAWTDNSNNETGFEIERDTNSAFTNAVAVATVGAGTTTYSNTGLSASTQYYYRVRAVNNSGASAYTTANATTQAGGGGGTATAKPVIVTNIDGKIWAEQRDFTITTEANAVVVLKNGVVDIATVTANGSGVAKFIDLTNVFWPITTQLTATATAPSKTVSPYADFIAVVHAPSGRTCVSMEQNGSQYRNVVANYNGSGITNSSPLVVIGTYSSLATAETAKTTYLDSYNI